MKKVTEKREEIVTNTVTIKKEITYTDASLCMKNRIANKNFKKEFATLNGARWMLLQEIGRMSVTDTPFTYNVNEAKQIIDNNKEQIPATKSGKFTVNILISFINKEIRKREKEKKEEEQKDLLCSRIARKKQNSL